MNSPLFLRVSAYEFVIHNARHHTQAGFFKIGWKTRTNRVPIRSHSGVDVSPGYRPRLVPPIHPGMHNRPIGMKGAEAIGKLPNPVGVCSKIMRSIRVDANTGRMFEVMD